MLPFALKVVWFVLSLTGIIACWIVMMTFSRAIDIKWVPMLYGIFNTMLQGAFCLGMIYEMNPYQMPRVFCIAQTFIIYYSSYSLTGTFGAFTLATAGTVLWPCSMGNPGVSALTWHRRHLFPIVVFPLACSAVAFPLLLKLDAIQPTDDLHCDVSSPVWARFLGYAGLCILFSLPCFFLCAAAAFRIFRMHLKYQRSHILINETNPAHAHSHPQPSLDGQTSALQFSASFSPPGPLLTASSDAERDTELGQKALPRLVTDDEALTGSQPHVQVSPVVASPSTGPNDGELSPKAVTLLAPSAKCRSRRASMHTNASLKPAMWRMIVFQMGFFSAQFLASLSTIIDVSKHRKAPTPFGTQHVALILVAWGPPVIFGYLPIVRRRLIFWRRLDQPDRSCD